MNPWIKYWRVAVFAACILISLVLVTNILGLKEDRGIGFGNGLDYGIDFAGGIQMQVKLDEPVSGDVMSITQQIIENRLNSMGLRDIPVRSWGDQYLLVTIARATPQEEARIEEILMQQARFEERIDGELAIVGDEVSVDMSPQGVQIYPVEGGYQWAVLVTHNREGACRFGQVGKGREGRAVDMFLDRPTNATILLSEGEYNLMLNLSASDESDRFFFGYTMLEVISERALLPVASITSSTADTQPIIPNITTKDVILAGSQQEIPEYVRNILEEQGHRTSRHPRDNLSYIDWVQSMIGLESALRLAFDPGGECQYRASIQGFSPTLAQAQAEVKRTQVLLTSGNLPVDLKIESKSTTPPALGQKFLAYSFYTAVVALLAVGLILYLRYRRPQIILPIMAASAGDIIMILGFASLISWELDLPAFAGIIAAVGTGVDHLIVITDETLKMSGRKRRISMSERIRKAFFIIFTAAATIFAAMMPLMIIGAGMLKGFAFTTLMGVFIGVIISRPAYAKIISQLLKAEE